MPRSRWSVSNVSYRGSGNERATGIHVNAAGTELSVCAHFANETSRIAIGARAIPAGKTYFELLCTYDPLGSLAGIAQTSSVPGTNVGSYPGMDAASYGYYAQGRKYNNNIHSAYGSSWPSNTCVVGVAVDMSALKVWFRLDGAWQASGDPAAGTGEAFSIASGTYYPAWSGLRRGKDYAELRTRASEFRDSAPSGFLPPEQAATASITVRDENGSLLANTSFNWAFFEGSTPGALDTAAATGTSATNGSGVLVVSIPFTYLRNGETGSLLISTTAGTAGVQCRSWYMPVTVTV